MNDVIADFDKYYGDNKHTRPDWDTWFMGICCLVATRSPDDSTAHGAVICNEDHIPLGMGYNGFPRNCDDSKFTLSRPGKYDIIIHAEENCILNSENLMSKKNCILYVTGMPCSRCFIKIMQHDICRVVYGNVSSKCVDTKQVDLVRDLAQTKGVSLCFFDGFDCQRNIHSFKDAIQETP